MVTVRIHTFVTFDPVTQAQIKYNYLENRKNQDQNQLLISKFQLNSAPGISNVKKDDKHMLQNT